MSLAPRSPARRTLAGALVLAAALALTACGGGSGSGTASSASSAAGSAGTADRAVGGAAEPGTGEKDAAPQSSSGGDQQAAPLVDQQKIVRTAQMSVQATDVLVAAAKVRASVEQAKGFIADEKTSTVPGPEPTPTPVTDPASPAVVGTAGSRTESVLTARVPNASLDRVMQDVAATGTVVSRTQSSDDVTAQYVDTASRVSSQRASVERVRALLARATSIGQVVQIEGELSRREADLESLEAQLKALEGQTALSTLTIELTPPPTATTAPKKDQGFVAGLRSGWDAFTTAVTALLTVLGALLPFLVVLALLAAPVLLWARRQRAAGRTTPTGSSGADGPSGPLGPTGPAPAASTGA